MSETKNFYAKLSEFRAKVGKIAKDGTNPAFRSKYATLPGILDAIEVPLAECGLTFVQWLNATEDGSVSLTTEIVETGDSEAPGLSSTSVMKPQDGKPQSYGSCITYARRYGLVTLLGLNVDDDDDGNAASGLKPKTAEEKFEESLPKFG
jgi:hypothetical protein